MRLGHAVPIAPHWTPRDEQAALIVREFQQQVDQLTPAELTDPDFYRQQAQKLATALARNYFPDAADPFSSLTVPEVLAAVRLALDDMEQWLLTSLPGSRLLSIKQWQSLQHAPKWIRRIQNTTWAASILMNPANIARLWTSRMTADPITTELQTEVLAVIYLRFIREMGFYLIEMNSGRLRGGADAYRRHFQSGAGHPAEQGEQQSPAPSCHQTVNVALVGQVSSGKSSLINALTGVHQAAVDLLPKTREVHRYQASFGTPPVRVTLVGHARIWRSRRSAEQLERDPRGPARIARRAGGDGRTLARPRGRPPHAGRRGRVVSVAAAAQAAADAGRRHARRLAASRAGMVAPLRMARADAAQRTGDARRRRYVRELFGSSLATVVPVCSDVAKDRAWGILEELMPALISILGEAQSAHCCGPTSRISTATGSKRCSNSSSGLEWKSSGAGSRNAFCHRHPSREPSLQRESTMRLITLEEHMLPAEDVGAAFGNILKPPQFIVDALADVGDGRLKAMDAAGIEVQVLSAVYARFAAGRCGRSRVARPQVQRLRRRGHESSSDAVQRAGKPADP